MLSPFCINNLTLPNSEGDPIGETQAQFGPLFVRHFLRIQRPLEAIEKLLVSLEQRGEYGTDKATQQSTDCRLGFVNSNQQRETSQLIQTLFGGTMGESSLAQSFEQLLAAHFTLTRNLLFTLSVLSRLTIRVRGYHCREGI